MPHVKNRIAEADKPRRCDETEKGSPYGRPFLILEPRPRFLDDWATIGNSYNAFQKIRLPRSLNDRYLWERLREPRATEAAPPTKGECAGV